MTSPVAGPSRHVISSTPIDLTLDEDEVDVAATGLRGATSHSSNPQVPRSPNAMTSSSALPTTPNRPHGPPNRSHTPSFQSPSSHSAMTAATTDPEVQVTGSSQPLPTLNGSTRSTIYGGHTMETAIDLTQVRIPSPPPTQPKSTVCIGAVRSRAIMLYPSPAAVIGASPPPGSKERFTVLQYMGSELLRVKLKLRTPNTKGRTLGEPWTAVSKPCIQVLTPHQSCYIGDLDSSLADRLIPHMMRGLLRLEGWAQRLQPDGHQFEIKLNVLFFTLTTNISYLGTNLLHSQVFLEPPNPPYDPSRHSENPPYHPVHATPEARAAIDHYHRLQYNAATQFQFSAFQQDKSKQIEIQRQQVDEVFKTMEKGGELEESIPGTMIKTALFRHQRKALTFLLEREQDKPSLKEAKYKFQRMEEKRKKKLQGKGKKADLESEGEDEQKSAEKPKAKKDSHYSLWESREDEKGRIKGWKNKITGEEVRGKHKPAESKGAILADDMGLGKTLSIISLIVATRLEARRWADTPLESIEEPVSEPEGPDVAEMKTKVYGMPDTEAESSKKRKHDRMQDVSAARRSRIVKRSKATLLVCPMSTISNWQEQIQAHWDGKIEVYGGASAPPNRDLVKSAKVQDNDFETLKVYIYHGAMRRMDPTFLADFDVVITSYNTLALEFSKQGGPVTAGDETPLSTGGSEDDDIAPPVHGEVKPEVQKEINSMEISDALLRKKKGRGTGKEQTSPLQAVDWFRVVLDEAHYIKTAKTIASQAACDLAADRRMAVTGTPIQNKIEDVWALFRFLRLYPVAEKHAFNTWINTPCKTGDPTGLARLQLLMGCCSIRRTKESRDERGKRILELPPRHEIQQWLDLDPDERAVYEERRERGRDMVKDLKEKEESGEKGSTSMANVLHEILILRQTCNHIDLVDTGVIEEDFDGTVMEYGLAKQGIEKHGFNPARAISMVVYLKEGSGACCHECGGDIGDYFPSLGLGGVEEPESETADVKAKKKIPWKPILTKCEHIYCPKCFKSTVYADWSAKKTKTKVARQCACGKVLKLPDDVTEVMPPGADDKELEPIPTTTIKRKKYIRPAGEPLKLSTKMKWLHDELLRHSKRNPFSTNFEAFAMTEGDVEPEETEKDGTPVAIKSVVFSQWTTMLDRVGDMLDVLNIKYTRLDGTMTLPDRQEAMDQLRTNKRVEVILVSTRAGGVGLNLTSACRAYLIDPYWNPAVEQQAIDRIHRMGQKRPVYATRLMIKDSIENNMDKIQKKKENLANMTLTKLSRKQLMEQKANDIAELFK